MHVPIDSTAHTTPAVEADDRYAQLFVAHRTAVFGLATLLCGDRHVAEEIAAEVFARVLPRWRRGDVREPMHYLRRAVVNEVHSRFRRRGHEQRALARLSRLPEADVVAGGRDLQQPLMDALLTLPVRQRAVV